MWLQFFTVTLTTGSSENLCLHQEKSPDSADLKIRFNQKWEQIRVKLQKPRCNSNHIFEMEKMFLILWWLVFSQLLGQSIN